MIKGEHFEVMRMMCATFGRTAKDHPLFEPEFKAALTINGIIESISDLKGKIS